ncbi:MAG: aldo/keto reductase [Solidesulfovibrio sp. DCME]|uniref:aldo/keto reductase n=1 Tax=Solidesulfovibrio sp. DCME TaxID=3447380 RepID=UPI003D0DCAA5
MRLVPLGSTGIMVSAVGFGGIPIIRLDFDEAQTVLRHAVDRGITFFDTANRYVDSEEKMGRAFAGLRHKVVIATKTGQRTAKAAMEELELSLARLKTDSIDLYQPHQVSKPEEFEALFAPGGVMDALEAARDQGKIRHVGVTSHSLPMARKLVATGRFATVQFPYNIVETEAAEALFPEARAAGLGILVMKPFAGGMLDDGGLALRFLRRDPGLLVLPGCDTPQQVDLAVDVFAAEADWTEADEAKAQAYRDELGSRFCRRCEYCQPCPQGVSITYAMMYKVVARRMSPAKAVQFAATTMESVRNCVDCGECATRCPYNLPIPEMLREHLDLYDSHKAAQ